MAKVLTLRVVTNDGQGVTENVTSVRAPGEAGSLGVLYNHAPLVTTIVPGKLFWRTPGGEQHTARIGNGLMEVAKNTITVLTEYLTQ
ncbi:MAG: F0F1 ATP synthase subunit epsilon [Candidatus Omnitrophica bacterium]|nr:F0F1 ATP synthase subunit epsilon [Candidatus Omnitrophota bacterium]